jgi:hypothetical protein
VEIYIDTTPTALRSAFVAPTSGGSVAGVCPQAGFLRTDDHTQGSFLAVDNAAMATGYRSWSPLIT